MLGMPAQARYSAVKEQRERADSTKLILQQMPTAGREAPPPRAVDHLEEPKMTPPEFPPAGGLPFPFCGVPGVLSPRAKAPPEPEKDMTDGAQVYEAVKEIAGDERPEVYSRMNKEEVLVAGAVSVGGGLPQSCKILRFWGFPAINILWCIIWPPHHKPGRSC